MNDAGTTTKETFLTVTIRGYEITVLSLAWSGFWIAMLTIFVLVRYPWHAPTMLVVIGAIGLLAVGPVNSAWSHPFYRVVFGVFLVFPGLYTIATTGLQISVVLIICGGSLVVISEITILLRHK